MNFQPSDYQTLTLSACSTDLLLLEDFLPWADRMRNAREWLEGIRADRVKKLRWEYDEAPAFSFAD